MTQNRGSNVCLLNHEPKVINYLLYVEGTRQDTPCWPNLRGRSVNYSTVIEH